MSDDVIDQGQADQFAALDAIGAEAAMGEQDQEQKQQQAGEAPNPMAGAAGWAMIAHGIGGMLSVALPEIAGAYNDQACMNWGVSMDALAQKYGWGDGVSRFGPEIAVIMATAPLVLPVVVAVRVRREAAKPVDQVDQVQGAEPMKAGAPVEVLP